MDKTKMFVFLMLSVTMSGTMASDGIFWSNKQDVVLEPMEKLFQSAHSGEPLIIFLIRGEFRLSDFSQLAGVYSADSGPGKSEIPTITESIRLSKGYTGEYINENLVEALKNIPKEKVVEYEDQINDFLENAAVVLVWADNLKVIDKKAAKLLNQWKPKMFYAILTGSSTHTRSKRANSNDAAAPVEASGAAKANYTYINGTSCMLYTNSVIIGVSLDVSSGTTKKIQWIDVPIETKNAKNVETDNICPNETSLTGNTTFTIKYTGNFNGSVDEYSISITSLSLKLNFVLKTTGYWYLINVTITELQVSCQPTTVKCPSSVMAPSSITGYLSSMYSVLHFAYACYETPAVYLNGTANTANFRIQFGKFQVQPFNGHGGNFTNNVDDCIEFFTIGTWMGIIVGGLMLLIFFYGIAMIANLKTMDRFDDPKGKTIQINTKD